MNFDKTEETEILHGAGFVNNRKFVDEILALKARYKRPAGCRFYHTWDHALNVLCFVNDLQLPFDVKRALSWAALYHDAVYDAEGSPSNEQRSADLLPENDTLAQHLILCTAHHDSDIALSQEAALFMDCDMAAFLIGHFAVVKVRDQHIRTELRMQYTQYTETYIQSSRDMFLCALRRRGVFRSPHFRELYGEAALENIRRLVTP
jgi:predicted metal-dependent HD superfamily phosphohydrolase